jgi:hypothetical protein
VFFTVTEEERLDALGVIIAVADEDTFAVTHIFAARVVDVGRGVFQPLRVGHGELAGGIDLAKQHPGNGIAVLHARIVGQQQGGDIIDPRHRDRRADIQDHDRVRVGGGHSMDQLVLHATEVHVGPVEPFRLVKIGIAGEDQRHISLASNLDRLSDSCGGFFSGRRGAEKDLDVREIKPSGPDEFDLDVIHLPTDQLHSLLRLSDRPGVRALRVVVLHHQLAVQIDSRVT